MTLARFASASLLCSFVGLAACSADIVPAEGMTMLAVGTDLVPGQDFTEVHFIASRDSGSVAGDEKLNWVPPADGEMPLTLALRGGANEQTVRVRLILTKGEFVVVTRHFELTLPPAREARLYSTRLNWVASLGTEEFTDSVANVPFGPFLNQPCKGGIESTNGDGDCISTLVFDSDGPPVIEAAQTEPYDLTRVYGGATSPADPSARCFDTTACFPAARTQKLGEPRRSDDGKRCLVDVPSGTSAQANVAISTLGMLAPAQNNGRQVSWQAGDGADKLIALDSESYSLSGDVLSLPGRYCDKILDQPAGQRAERIWVSDACETKTRPLFVCGSGGAMDSRYVAANRITPN